MERVRFTIAVDAEVHAAFVELADSAGQSLSRAVGDWLRDTSASSLFVARKMRELRLSPEAALRELLAFQEVDAKRSLEDDTADTRHLLGVIARGGLKAESGSAATGAERTGPRARARVNPPSSNTGGKGRQAAQKGPKS